MLEILTEYWPALWAGFTVTVQLSLASFALAVVIGVLLAAMRVSPVAPLQRFVMGYVAFFRNTPIIALLFLYYFGGPYVGFQQPSFTTAAITLGMYTGAYMSETVRSGINAVSTGQAEAARAIGLKFSQLLTAVVLPQALRTVIPPVGNLFIANAKNTAVTLGIGVTELTAISQRIINNESGAVTIIALVALFYVAYLLLASWVFGALETRFAIKR